MEKPSLPAKYDPARQPNGQFVKGNTVRTGWNMDVSKRFKSLRAAWYDATTTQDMIDVAAELKALCLTCPSPDVKLKAIVYFLDRCLGKPVERIDVDVSSEQRPAPVLDLSPDEVKVLERVVARTELPEPGEG
jgi:hypothetical protein